MNVMKSIKLFLVLAMFLMVGCGNPDNNGGGNGGNGEEWQSTGKIVGEWELTEWNDSEDNPMRVYIRFNENDTFDLYQRIYSAIWVHYTGTFSLKGSVLKGVYSDGEAWSADYNIAYSTTPLRIRLTNTEDENDVSIYAASEIPENIIEDSTEATNVRSVTLKKFL